MTKLLEKAIAEMSKLSSEEQDILAQRLLEELDEEAFDAKIASTADRLAILARQAQEDLHAGRTEEMDLDS